MHGGGRGEADRLADLADRRRVAPLAHGRLDALEDLPLAGGERDRSWQGALACSSRGCEQVVDRDRSIAHLFGEHLFDRRLDGERAFVASVASREQAFAEQAFGTLAVTPPGENHPWPRSSNPAAPRPPRPPAPALRLVTARRPDRRGPGGAGAHARPTAVAAVRRPRRSSWCSPSAWSATGAARRSAPGTPRLGRRRGPPPSAARPRPPVVVRARRHALVASPAASQPDGDVRAAGRRARRRSTAPAALQAGRAAHRPRLTRRARRCGRRGAGSVRAVRCPACGSFDDKVVDSRQADDGAADPPPPGVPRLRPPLHHLRAGRGGAARRREALRRPRAVRPGKVAAGRAAAAKGRPVEADERSTSWPPRSRTPSASRAARWPARRSGAAVLERLREPRPGGRRPLRQRLQGLRRPRPTSSASSTLLMGPSGSEATEPKRH